MNVGGIGSKVDKRQTVFNSIKITWDITILTETKFKAEQITRLKQEWNGMSVHSTSPTANAKSGVSILFKRGLAFNPVRTGDDGEGRIAWAEIEIGMKKVLIIGVYAPSEKDDHEFFEKLFRILEGCNYDHVVISGDFNVGLDESLDYMGYSNKSPRPKSREVIKKHMKQHGICDIFRERNPKKVENTWQQRDKHQARPTKQARLDYFLVDNEMRSFVELVGAAEPFNPDYDHRAILLKVDFCKVKRGKGYWKMNNALLNESEYVEMVQNTIVRVMHDYQEMDKEGSFLSKSQIKALSPEEKERLKMTLNPHQFLEFLLFTIKGETRKYGAKRKQNLVSRVEQLEDELLKLKTIIDEANMHTVQTGHSYTPEEESRVIEALANTNSKRKEIEKLQAHINQGAYVRTGQHWKCESEAGTKLFFQQEKWRGDQRYIGILEVDAGKEDGSTKLIESQPEIEEEIHRFYKELYKKRPTESSTENLKNVMGEGYSDFENILGKKLPSTVQEKLQTPISKKEIMQALQKGQHGKAPGVTGFTREFYKKFSGDLIGPIMNYVKFTEEIGQLSEQQRQGVITLLPKGTKCKKSLKNWRPITLLTTLYKIISGTIAERVKKVLPHIIDDDQKGFVDGRYMGEVTRTLYDTIHDAWSHDKKGVLLSIDFEKAFDSLSHDFIEKVMEVAGFGSMLRKWVKVLLKDFSSRVNHVGNLLREINLGRGARQGDPIASLLFVLCIEILLIAIRSNPKIEPYQYFKGMHTENITSKTEAFADDVTLTLPYKESSIREAVATIESFSKISGLRINTGKTQVMAIGRHLNTTAKLAPDLGLNWVDEITILGIKLYPNPAKMVSNFDDKVDDIKQLLNRWTFRNLTVYARIQIVKSLGLSKLTHVVQVVPNPPPSTIKDLQKKINQFVWEGGMQKKHVVNQGRAQQPQIKGGLAVPNVNDFWISLKCTWIHRLAQAPDTAKWKRLALRDLKDAMSKQSLNCSNLVVTSPQQIAEASKKLTNKFWAPIWEQLPIINNSYNHKYKESQYLSERLLWGTPSFTDEAGNPLNPRNFEKEVVEAFKVVGDCIDNGMANNETIHSLSEKGQGQFIDILSAITRHLIHTKRTWKDICKSPQGPYHTGWSRMLCGMKKSKDVCRLVQYEKHEQGPRNENEAKWNQLADFQTMSETRWDKVYKNLSKVKCNLRIKYQEWRIAWGRQELNRERVHYQGGNLQVAKCSYCNLDIETEYHLYIECEVTEEFWRKARDWVFRKWAVLPPLSLKCSKIFGMENEKPDDLLNIFYRNVRYTIFKGRETRHQPCFKLLEELLLEELKRKYTGEKSKKYEGNPEEHLAINWYRQKLKDDPTAEIG